MHEEDEEVEEGFKVGAEGDEILEPEDILPELPLDDDDNDPENRFH